MNVWIDGCMDRCVWMYGYNYGYPHISSLRTSIYICTLYIPFLRASFRPLGGLSEVNRGLLDIGVLDTWACKSLVESDDCSSDFLLIIVHIINNDNIIHVLIRFKV